MIYGLILLEHVKLSDHEQREGILSFAKRTGLKIDKFISYKENPNLTEIKNGDTVICFEWSCLCKKRTLLNEFISYFLKNKISFYSATSEYNAGELQDFEKFYYAFGLYKDIHFNFLSNKNLQAVNTRIINGKEPGRHKGSKNIKHILDGKEKKFFSLYAQGLSMYAIAKQMNVSAPTIKRFLIAQN